MKNIYLQIPVSAPDTSNMVLATVTRTEGSTPQKPGSSALFNWSGLVAGTIGGGVLEGNINNIARECLLTKQPGHFIFRLDTSVSGGEDALCGGKIGVLVDPDLVRHIHVFEALRRSAESRIPGVLVTHITYDQNDKMLINRYWENSNNKSRVPDELLMIIEPEIKTLLCGTDAYDFRELILPKQGQKPSPLLFLEPVIPLPRLIIAGAGHIGKALSQIGSMLDFEVTVIDDRPEFANPDNIPHANHIINGDIGASIARIEKGSDTYIVIVTRGHKDDGNALKACIGSEAAYIGMIGSRNKVELMRREFIGNSWSTQEQWDRIFAPIGIDIRSKTVEEIAVSIAAQLVQIKNNK